MRAAQQEREMAVEEESLTINRRMVGGIAQVSFSSMLVKITSRTHVLCMCRKKIMSLHWHKNKEMKKKIITIILPR